MSIESEIFNKCRPNFKKLIEYGFERINDKYKYSKLFMEDAFRADITINDKGQATGKVIEVELNEEYTNFRIEEQIGEFVGNVRQQYKNILKDIKDDCFEKEYFKSNQANRITKLILNKHGDTPEFLWEKFPDFGVFRNSQSKKWYAIIMNIDKSKIDKDTGRVDILNVKLNESLVKNLLKQKGYYEAYHMKKTDWITILLDDFTDDNEIMKLIETSYLNVNNK